MRVPPISIAAVLAASFFLPCNTYSQTGEEGDKNLETAEVLDSNQIDDSTEEVEEQDAGVPDAEAADADAESRDAALADVEAEKAQVEESEIALVAEAPLPPTGLRAEDSPNSAGDSVILTWTPAANEAEAIITGYEVSMSSSPDGPFETVAQAAPGSRGTRVSDSRRIRGGNTYYFRIESLNIDQQKAASEVVSVVPEKQWFHMGRWFTLVLALLLSAAILFNIYRARMGADLYVRRIAGLESVEEAIGRSTEMGKPVLYVPGIRDMDDIQTIASMSILSHVAKLTAEHDTPILVPNTRAVVMSTAQEVVKQAYLDAGRPDAYNSDNIRYLTDDQFGYVAGVDGIMIRDKPAANFFLGAFFAESLILAETGASTGAIQVAGTAMPSQLPFFVAACDYTLIGEELFAASAYLAREPMGLGSLKGQDWGKFVFMIAVVVGALTTTIVHVGDVDPSVWWNIATWFRAE